MTLPKFGRPKGPGRAHQHRRDAAPPAPPPPPAAQATNPVGRERHEAPDRLRLNALDVQFHGVRGSGSGRGRWRGQERRGGGVARQPLLPGAGVGVRFPPVLVGAGWHCRRREPEQHDHKRRGRARRRAALPGRGQQGSPLRRGVLHRGDLDRHLLPAVLPGDHAEAGEHAVLPQRGGGPGGGLPGLQAVPPGRLPRLARVEHPGRHGGPGDAADRGRGGRPGRR